MPNGADRVEATGRTMATAGRAVMLSGVTVAIGLAVLVALPVPFIRSMGIGGMLVPVSAVLTGADRAARRALPRSGRRVDRCASTRGAGACGRARSGGRCRSS